MIFKLGSIIFSSKKLAIQHVKELLHTQPIGVAFIGNDYNILLGLLIRLPSYTHFEEYRLCSTIKVLQHAAYKSLSFHACATGYDAMPFSYKRAFNRPTPRNEVLRACRSLVRYQIDVFKLSSINKETGKITCSVSRKEYLPENIDIDHDCSNPKTTFVALADSWMKDESITHNDTLTQRIPNTTTITFVEARLNDSWAAYHTKHAVLRCVERNEHRELTKKTVSIYAHKFKSLTPSTIPSSSTAC